LYVSDYDTNPWSTNIKLDNLRASCKKTKPFKYKVGGTPPIYLGHEHSCQQHWQAYSKHTTCKIYSHYEMLEIIYLIRQMRHTSASQQQFDRHFFLGGDWWDIIWHQS